MLPIRQPTEKCWQPQDFLPHPEAPEFLDAVRACCVPDWLPLCAGCPWLQRASALHVSLPKLCAALQHRCWPRVTLGRSPPSPGTLVAT